MAEQILSWLGQGLSVSATTDSDSLVKTPCFVPSRSMLKEAKMGISLLSLCVFAVFSLLSPDLLTQITALSHPDFITERSQSGSETQHYCWNQPASVLRFLFSVPSGHPCGQVMSFFSSPVPLWEQVLRENWVTQ